MNKSLEKSFPNLEFKLFLSFKQIYCDVYTFHFELIRTFSYRKFEKAIKEEILNQVKAFKKEMKFLAEIIYKEQFLFNFLRYFGNDLKEIINVFGWKKEIDKSKVSIERIKKNNYKTKRNRNRIESNRNSIESKNIYSKNIKNKFKKNYR